MGRITFGMRVSLDGYIAGLEGGPGLPVPGEALHRVFNDFTRNTQVLLYGRRMYEKMSYWQTADRDPNASEVERDYALAWQKVPKVVFSTTLAEVGPNARLVRDDVAGEVRALKARYHGDIEVAGAGLAATFESLGLLDEYRLYVSPVVLGGGKPFFAQGSRPPDLKLLETAHLPQDVVMLRYGRGSAPI